MKLITLINSFHNTSVKVSSKWGNDQREAWINIQCQSQVDKNARRTFLRIYKALCGIHGCMCGIVRP